jgi:hypothetical protein
MPETPMQVRVLEALQVKLESITKGDCYSYTLKGHVHIGRTLFDEQDPLPIVSILEVPLPAEQRAVPRGAAGVSGPWEMFIQGWVTEPNRTAKFMTRQAYYLKNDIIQCLTSERQKFNDLMNSAPILGIREITDIQVDRGVVRPDDERSSTALFWVPLTIGLAAG